MLAVSCERRQILFKDSPECRPLDASGTTAGWHTVASTGSETIRHAHHDLPPGVDRDRIPIGLLLSCPFPPKHYFRRLEHDEKVEDDVPMLYII